MNETLKKFGYSETVIHEADRWVVMLRPKQATLGALVLAAKEDVTAFSALSDASFAEMPRLIVNIEQVLAAQFAPDKINYLMLMMVDPHVHFHVLPRYSQDKQFDGLFYEDPGWPKAPDLSHTNEIPASSFKALQETLQQTWP